jgi:predicted RNA-binding protein with EMAP domain
LRELVSCWLTLETEIGTGHEDNNQGALVANDVPRVEDMDKFQGSLQEKMIKLIQSLRDHLNAFRQDLIDNNINAATDFADFIRDMEEEIEDLRDEAERKQAYLQKLTLDI